MLTINNISLSVNNRPLVKDISFSVKPGELVAITGANGAGKSTLLRLISGDKKPDKGNIIFNDQDISSYTHSQLALKRAMLCQQNLINLDFKVEDIVLMGRYPHYNNIPSVHDMDVVQTAMEAAGIEHLAQRSFLSLSGGEQQRVQLSRLLSQIWDCKDALVLLDEPLTGLDIQYQQQTMSIAKLLAKKGFIVIAILHDINLAAQYASRIIMLKNGRKWYDGSPGEVINPRSILDIFDIEAEMFTNPKTLRPFILLKEIDIPLVKNQIQEEDDKLLV